MKHSISSIILNQEPVIDCSTICLLDTSEYSETVPIENPILRIHPPNWRDYKSIVYTPKSINIIRPEDIGFKVFSGGVYKFIQSVKPNSKVSYEFCWLNICPALSCLRDIVCEEENEEKLAKVLELKLQLTVAQELVQCCDIKRGTEMYNTVLKEIENLKKDCIYC